MSLSRRWLTGCCLVATAVPLTLGSSGARAADSGQGRFLTPFREDGARYVAATHAFVGGFAKGGKTDGNGCLATDDKGKKTGAPKDNPNVYDCLPAGAAMVALPNGKVVFWNALEGEEAMTGTHSLLLDGGRLTANDESRVLDLSRTRPTYSTPSPADGGARQPDHPDDLPLGPFAGKHYAYNNGSLFCSDQVLLGNGDVISVGGTDYYTEPYVPVADTGLIELQGLRNSRIFDTARQRWAQGPAMTYGRWYPSLVTLGNGQLLVASGVGKLLKPAYPTRPQDSGSNVKQTETLTLGSKAPRWVQNPPSADKSLPLFPRLHLLPNGHVYYDAAGQDFNPFGQSYDEALWQLASSYDPRTRTWTDLGVPGSDQAYLSANPGATQYAGFRGSTFSAALPMRPSAVAGGTPVYTSASYLTAGGVLGVSPGSYLSVANSRITTVDTAGGAQRLSTVGTGDLQQRRWYGNATALPNGQVFVSSGSDVDAVTLPGSESPILSTELFTPTMDNRGVYTGGSWANAGDQFRKRTYHNNAVLLADGSVLIGGHAPITTGYFQTIDTPDMPGRRGTNNHHDASFQVWQPPYFNDPARPVLTGLEGRGRILLVHTPDARAITSVVLVRNTAKTHLVDGDARTVVLPVLRRSADAVAVVLPATTNVLPGGPYLLFANKTKKGDLSGRDAADLLPSRGQQVFVTGTVVPRVLVPPHAVRSSAGTAAVAGAPTAPRAQGVAAGTATGTAAGTVPAAAAATRARAAALALVAERTHHTPSAPLPVLPLVATVGVGLGVAGAVRRRRRRLG